MMCSRFFIIDIKPNSTHKSILRLDYDLKKKIQIILFNSYTFLQFSIAHYLTCYIKIAGLGKQQKENGFFYRIYVNRLLGNNDGTCFETCKCICNVNKIFSKLHI